MSNEKAAEKAVQLDTSEVKKAEKEIVDLFVQAKQKIKELGLKVKTHKMSKQDKESVSRGIAGVFKKELQVIWAYAEKDFFIYENMDNVKRQFEQQADQKIKSLEGKAQAKVPITMVP